MLDQELKYLISLIFAISAVLTFLIIYLTASRLLERKNERRKEWYFRKFKDEIYNYLLAGEKLSRHLIPICKWKIEAMEHVFLQYIKTAQNEEMLMRITNYAEIYLLDYYRKLLCHRKWSIRINTLYCINEFQLTALAEDVESLLYKKKNYTKEEYFEIYKLLVKKQRNCEQMVCYFAKIGDIFSEFEYRRLLMEMTEQQIEGLLFALHKLPYSLQLSIFDVIGIRKLESCIPALEQHLQAKDIEMRLRVLKAMSQFPHLSNLDQYYRFAESQHWQERLMFAKLTQHFNEKEAIAFLLRLIKDPSWWVRQQAAKSLQMLQSGYQMLESIIKENEDPFAADMAKEILRKADNK